VWIVVQPALGLRDLVIAEQFESSPPECASAEIGLVRADGLNHLGTDRLDRIQGADWILEYERYLSTTNGAHLPLVAVMELAVVEPDPPAGNLPGRLDQPEDG
jgi:hypothetical protein